MQTFIAGIIFDWMHKPANPISQPLPASLPKQPAHASLGYSTPRKQCLF
ncbi:hypothetical protein [Nitrosomonas sp. ANs5]